MFLGDSVKDQDFNVALFEDLGSAPRTMEAARACDAPSLLPGYEVKRSDAISAYTQAYLESTADTWASLPPERWPKDWVKRGFANPVAPLVLNLYGHPDAGDYWEQRCEELVEEIGFQPIDGWTSTYWHAKDKALRIVRVDDFELAAPTEKHRHLQDELRKRINMDAFTAPDHFLGCYAERFEATVAAPTYGRRLSYHLGPKHEATKSLARMSPTSRIRR